MEKIWILKVGGDRIELTGDVKCDLKTKTTIFNWYSLRIFQIRFEKCQFVCACYCEFRRRYLHIRFQWKPINDHVEWSSSHRYRTSQHLINRGEKAALWTSNIRPKIKKSRGWYTDSVVWHLAHNTPCMTSQYISDKATKQGGNGHMLSCASQLHWVGFVPLKRDFRRIFLTQPPKQWACPHPVLFLPLAQNRSFILSGKKKGFLQPFFTLRHWHSVFSLQTFYIGSLHKKTSHRRLK